MASMSGTLDAMQKSLKLSIKWLVYFARKLQETGDPTLECDELRLFSNVMDLNENVDNQNHVDVFCSSLDTLNIPLPSTSGTSCDNVEEEQSFKTKRRSSMALVTLDSEDSDTQNENSESSEIEITCPVRIFSQSSSTSHPTRKSKSFAGNSLPLKRTCTRGDSPLRTTDVVREHLPSNATPRMDRAGNSSQNQNAATIGFADNNKILISFPTTPLLREQSVQLHYDCDRVQVGYQQFRRDCSEDISINNPPNPAKRSRVDLDRDVIVLESDENNIAAPVPRENAVAIDPRDIPSCSSAPFLNPEGNRSAYIPAEGNRSAHIPAEGNRSASKPSGRHASQEENIIHVNTDVDQEVSKKATCPEVVYALEVLVDTYYGDKELERKCEQLKTSLQNCTDSQASIAANEALYFFCSRNANPLYDYLITNYDDHLFPFNELCVVKVFNNMDRSIFRDKLEDVLYKEIVGHGKKWSIVVLSTLCRVWAYLKGVKKCIRSTRSLCYHLLKEYPNLGPYYIASILSVYSTALEPPVIESEKCMYRVFCYMITNKPKDLPDYLWNRATHLISKYLPADTTLTAEDIIDAVAHSFIGKSSNAEFLPSDAKNYVDAIEILSSRFDWSWAYHNVIDKFFIPLLQAFSSTAAFKICGAAALSYRLIGSLGCGQYENSTVRELAKNIYASMLSKKGKIPAFVFQEARHAIFILESGHKEIGITGAPFKEWAVRNGYIEDT